MALHFIPIAIGLGKLGVMLVKSDAVNETARHFAEIAHERFPNKLTRKALDILDHDDTKHIGIVLKDGIIFEDVQDKIADIGDIAIPVKDNQTAATVTGKDGASVQVDFVMIAREDVMDKATNMLLDQCKEIVNFTPKQPVTALGHAVRSVSGLLPDSVRNKLPGFLRQ